ncbi:MAG TPA: hypothetical protein VKR58_09820 [Aquella sp.]|nr:hypothetical protein [Aquella sp.]
MKNHKVGGYLFYIFITSILCIGAAWAGPKPVDGEIYQALICNPIADRLTIVYPDGKTTKLLEAPTASNLTEMAANGETAKDEFINKPSMYILCKEPGVLLKDCYPEELKSPVRSFTSINKYVQTNIYTFLHESLGPFKEFNLSGSGDRIAGSTRHENENGREHRYWSLARSENSPNYWKFIGEVSISIPRSASAVKNSTPEYRNYYVNHYYTCKLESGNLVSLMGGLDKLDVDNRKY